MALVKLKRFSEPDDKRNQKPLEIYREKSGRLG